MMPRSQPIGSYQSPMDHSGFNNRGEGSAHQNQANYARFAQHAQQNQQNLKNSTIS